MTGATDSESVSERVVDGLNDVTRWDVLRAARTLLLVAIVVPFVIYAVPQVVGASHSYVVLSGSMEPAISTGDVIVVDDVAPSQIEEGDVITFGGSDAEPPTTHRVIAVGQSGGERVFRTKGDANEDPDASPVPASEVVGKVVELPSPTGEGMLFVIPYIGYVVEFVGTPLGFIALVVVPFGLLGVSELWKYAFGSKRDGDVGDEVSPSVTRASSDGGKPNESVEESEVSEESETSFTIDSRYLTVLVAVLAVVGTVAGLRAYRTEDPMLAAGAAAVLAAGLVVAGFVFYGDDAADAASTPGATTTGHASHRGGLDSAAAGVNRRVTAAVSADLREWPRVEVESAETLFEMAAADGSWVVEDEETGDRFVFSDGVAYAAPPAETAEPAGDESAFEYDEATAEGPSHGEDGENDAEGEVIDDAV